MTPTEIKEAVKEAIIESRGDFYIEPKDHFVDHGYIKGQRRGVKIVRTGILYSLGVAICGFIVWVLQSILTINPPTP